MLFNSNQYFVRIKKSHLNKLFSFTQSNLVSECMTHWENSFFESKKVFLNQKSVLSFKEIDLFTIKTNFLNQQNFFHNISKKLFSGCMIMTNKNVEICGWPLCN